MTSTEISKETKASIPFQSKLVSVMDTINSEKLISLKDSRLKNFIFAKPPETKNTLGRERICCSNFFPFILNSKYDLFTKYSIQINPSIPDDSKSYRRHLFHLGSKLIK